MANLVVVSIFILLWSSVFAASDTCTVFEIHTTIQGLDGLFSSEECADYAVNSSFLVVPCDATSCISSVGDLVSRLPNCVLSASDNGGIRANKKTELQNGLDECSTDSSFSLSVEAVASSTATSAPSTNGEECTSAEASMTAQLYLGAAGSPACEPYATMDESSMSIYIYAPCSATQCVSVLETMVEQLPYCSTDGVNLKRDVLQSLASCTGTSSSSSAANAIPQSGSRSPNECTSDDISSLAYLTSSIVTSADCEQYIVSTSKEWLIAVPCSATKCLATLEEVVQQMPDCEFEGTNYKEELSFQQTSCSSSATGSKTSGNDGSIDSLSTAAPASDSSATSTDTSASSSSGHFTLSAVAYVFILVILVTM